MRTYGTLTYDSNAQVWLIECEPHVALKLKQNFKKIKAHQVGTLQLADTIDNCRDLEWFIGRYPLACDQLDHLAERAAAHRERETLLAQLLAGSQTGLEFPMAKPPREYQVTAAAIARANRGLILADVVGLGKTVSAIATFVEPSLQPVLVVVQTHLQRQWQNFIAEFAPHLTSHILTKGTPYDIRVNGRTPEVIISTYHKLRGWAETLAPLIKTVVYDECQELRRAGSGKYNSAQHLSESATLRLGLSATPFYNYGEEMFHVAECISPGTLGSYDEFLTEWCTPCYGKYLIKDPKAFGSYLREIGLLLRRTGKDVGRELPACSIIPLPIEADLAKLEKMERGCDELARIILRDQEDWRGQKMNAASEFDMRLRQATGIAKAPYVAAFVRMLWESTGEPIVLFGWHREVYSIWQERLADLNPVMYTGSESPAQKEKSKQAFINGDSKVMLISLRSGSGMDGIQKVCSNGVIGELDWSPGVYEQCIGRYLRDGQENPCFAYFPIAEYGSDPIVSDINSLKKVQIDGVRDPDKELVEKLQIDPYHVKKLAESYLSRHKGAVGVPQMGMGYE